MVGAVHTQLRKLRRFANLARYPTSTAFKVYKQKSDADKAEFLEAIAEELEASEHRRVSIHLPHCFFQIS